MRITALTVALALTAWATGPAPAPAQEMRVGLYENPPKIFTDASDEPSGFWPTVTRDLAAEIGVRATFVPCLWADCLAMLEAGEIDVMPDMTFTPDRAERFVFSRRPVLQGWSTLLAPAGGPVADVEGLGDARVAAVRGTVEEAILEAGEDLPRPREIVAVDSVEAARAAMLDGDAEATLVGNFFASRALDVPGIVRVEGAIRPAALYYAFRPDIDPEFVAAFDRAVLAQQSVLGTTYQAAQARWLMGVEARLPLIVELTVIAAVAAAVIAGIFALVLRTVVRRRTAELRSSLRALRREIEHRKAAEENAANAQKHEALGRLVGGVAHDFNNLLAVIKGNLDLMAEDGIDAAEGECLQDAIRAADRGGALTRQLLSFGRRAHLEPVPFDLADAVRRVRGVLRRTLPENVEIEIVADDGPHLVTLDPGQFDNAILNLAINARDAIEGPGRITIGIARRQLAHDEAAAIAPTLRGGPFVALSFADTGTGMPPDVLDQAFDPFFTTKGVGKGTGMGLAMVEGFVSQSGGGIEAESAPGEGTVVRLFFPAERAAELVSLQPSETVIDGGRRRVLLVEDEAPVRRTMRRQIEAMGFEVAEAANGDDALDIVRGDTDLALVLSDVIMPGRVQGHDLARSVAGLDRTLPVILMSGYAGRVAPEDRADEPVLQKPVDRSTLAEAIARALATPHSGAA